MTLKDQVNKAYKDKVIKVHKNAIRTTAVRALGNISQMTPVDTGRARANWNISVNTIDTTTTERTGAMDSDANARDALANLQSNDTVYISNHLPYIARLNDGYSKQAPANFVEKGLELSKRQAEAAIKRGGV